jgi:hypothetical protein
VTSAGMAMRPPSALEVCSTDLAFRKAGWTRLTASSAFGEEERKTESWWRDQRRDWATLHLCVTSEPSLRKDQLLTLRLPDPDSKEAITDQK